MEKTETVELVNRVYAAYNQVLIRATAQDTQRVWHDLLGEFDMTVVYDTFLELATYSVFMPTPGAIRRAIIEKGGDKIPSPLAAWGTLQQLARNAHSGTYEDIPVHEVIKLTVADIGHQAYELHTNGDRELFIATYERVCESYLRERLKLQ